MRKQRRLEDAYRFIGFRPEPRVRGVFGDPKARIVRLVRRGKKRTAELVVDVNALSTTARPVGYATSPVGTPGPKVLGIDELSIGRGHNYRIIVSDLVRGRPIWFGGTDRSEKSMDLFFQWLGPRKCKGIRLAVMDMWKPFRNSTLKAGNAPQVVILYDKFHILKRLNEALDKVRKSE